MKSLFVLQPLTIVFIVLVYAVPSDKLKKQKMNPPTNPVGYFEIPVMDMERAIKFYQAVFGYTFQREVIDNNEMALFPLSEDNTGISGALAKGESYIPSKNGSLVYFNTSDIDNILLKVKQHGGEVLYLKTSIGELGFVAEFEDSEGNRIALHSLIE